MKWFAKVVIGFFVISLLFSTPLASAKPVGKEKALKAAKTFLQAEKIREKKKLTNVIATKAQKQIRTKESKVGGIKEIRGNGANILAYVTELEPEGFIITSADDAISPIIAYSFRGKFSYEKTKQNVLLDLVQSDVKKRIEILDSKTNETKIKIQSNNSLWDRFTSEEKGVINSIESTTQWGPLINNDPNQSWEQTWPYNKFCPNDPAQPQLKCLVGCTATAMAQIINYWGFPPTVTFSSSDRYESWFWQKSFFSHFWIDDNHDLLAFPSFDQLNAAMAELHYDSDPNEEAYLSFAVGIKNRMQYSAYASGAWLSANAYKAGFSYGSASYKPQPDWSEYKSKIVENIKKEKPVQIGMRGSSEPHSLIIDGYKTTGEFHLNFGHGNQPYELLWYFLPTCMGWDTVSEIVYNICPYPGWGQYGGDSRNTRRTRYNGPEDHTVKWIVDTGLLDPQTELATAIVGSGGNVYAFCQAMNSSDPGKLFIITPHGEPVSNISIPNPANIASEPAQASSFGLPIYIAFNNKVYKISLEGNVELFYEDADARVKFTYPTQVDTHGNVYVCGDWKLRSLDLNGDLRWEKPFTLGGSLYFVSGIAIDEDRTRVYAKYYDEATDTAHLWALNKYTGDEIWDAPVPSVASPMAAQGEPTVGDDGTVFARFFTSLRAYNPDSSMKWDYTVNTGQEYLEPFVSLGPNDNIYICGTDVASTPKHAWIRSLKISDKSLLWEFTKDYPSDTSSYDFRAPIVAYDNNMVYAVFHELSSSGYRKLYALKETAGGLTEM